jgi:hypothetical protein
MSAAAKQLGLALAGKLRQAADARWLTTGEVITASPLTVDIDGAPVPVSATNGYVGAPGDVVLVGVLRGGLASVSYVVFGKLHPGQGA